MFCRLVVLCFCAAGTLATLPMVPLQPAKEDVSVAARTKLVEQINMRRAQHGTCSDVKWDAALAAQVKDTVEDNMKCTPTPDTFGITTYSTWVTTFQTTPVPVWNPTIAVNEWFFSSGFLNSNLFWNTVTKVGCAQCRDGIVNNGHMVYVTCRFTEVTGTDIAFNTDPQNAVCDRCAAVTCPPVDPTQCIQSQTCDSSTGSCFPTLKPDNTPCDDGDAITQFDSCTNGVCTGFDLCAGVTCQSPPGQCFAAATCDHSTGICPANPTKPDNTPCDDGDASTDFDLCTNGVCAGFDLCAGITCQPLDECHVVGACVGGVCTNPSKPDKTPCRGGAGECMGGKCLDVSVCRATPASAKHGGMALAGSPIAAADLTAAHTEPLDKGYLQDFSQVAMSGVEDGLVYRLPGDSLDEELVFKCPVGCGGQCEVYVVGYHCPACQLSMKHGVVKTAQEAGWEVAPCAPELHVDGKKQPMVSMRRVIAAGGSASFPSAGGVSGLALSFTRKASKAVPDCAAQDSTSCDGVVGCKLHNQECRTEGWCPRRFSKGPFVPRTGPGCSSWCLSA
eukprot:TRINITY_DN1118_c0_g1_i1.p1 TRINITY_DN1118_c0_g1~~TRINITY_DN1118_c0_g1_i1.p1  ORF type:complete len:561 (+),score=123.63 TRINITY_DN1118_c0_g1_i1:89-1771(+)